MFSNENYCLFSNDVEEHSIWYNCLRYETGKKVVDEGIPLMLEIYAELGIKSTFFITGFMAEHFPHVVKIILSYGHEIASHGYSHEVDKSFDILNYSEQIQHLTKSKKILEDLSGQEVISFRAPALRINKYTPIALAETGFKIDSSVASQRFDMFLSFGSKNKMGWLNAPRLPYITAKDNLFKKGSGTIVEVPLTAFILPFTSTTMRILPQITSIQKKIFYFESIFNKKPIVFDIHPNEFINESNGKRIIKRRTNNIFSYVLRDIIRAKLKIKNLGADVIPLYKDILSFYNSKGYKMITIADYCRINRLIKN